MVIYFSGTGNSRFAAEFLANRLGDEVLNAGEEIRAGRQGRALTSERPWVFVSPTYAWQMPRVMAEYIRSLALSGSKDVYFVLTCGGDIGDADEPLAQLCVQKGLHYRGTMEAVMPDNYILMFRAPEEEAAKQMVEQVKPRLAQAAENILCGEALPARKKRPFDKIKSGAVNNGFYRYYIKADPFRVTQSCVSCGLCESLCPLNNITLTEGKPVWGKNCTQCMACICRCPVQAIEYGRKTVGKPRYICPEESSCRSD